MWTVVVLSELNFVIFSVLCVDLLGLSNFLMIIYILRKILICNMLKSGVKNILKKRVNFFIKSLVDNKKCYIFALAIEKKAMPL